MSVLILHHESRPETAEAKFTAFADIAARLDALGVRFERWQADAPLEADAGPEAVLAAYAEPVERLSREYGFRSVDAVSLRPDHPDKATLRGKFLSEHTHADFEARFFVAGKGLFYLHPDERVFALLCEAGDLISVSAGVKHWFDMGENPDFRCIRLFTTPDGWQAQFTGSGISGRFATFDRFVAEQA